MKSPVILILIIAFFTNIAEAKAQAVWEYFFRRATISLPLLTQSVDPKAQSGVIATERLLTKKVINLAMGRNLNDKVPANEILALAATPQFDPSRPVFVVVIDTSKIDKTVKPPVAQPGVILRVVAHMTSFQYVFGKPNSSTYQGFGTAEIHESGKINAGNTIRTLQGAAILRGRNFLASALTGRLWIEKDGATLEGIVAGGTLRSSGAELFTMEIDPADLIPSPNPM